MSVATDTPRDATSSVHDGKSAKIVVLDNIAQEGLSILESAPGIEFDIKTGLSGPELREVLTQYDGAVCRSGVKITAESLEENQRLRAIVRAGVGTDNIDKTAAARLGIIVMNTPTGNTVSTAELTMALMLGLSRNVAAAHASLKSGNWDRKKFSGSQLAGKTLGIVGLGRIGQEVVARAKSFGMNVLGFDPFLSTAQAEKLGVTKVAEVDDLLPTIDYLTVHTPLTPETTGLINSERLNKMKTGVRLINCARGGIYDESALIEGLQSGKLGGVALDVYENEPCTDSPLFGMDNVLCTPHLGASTEEAQINVAVEAVQLLLNYLQNGEIKYAVNALTVDPKTLNALRSYCDVAYRLGILMNQWHQGAIKRCQLKYKGEVAGDDTRLLTSAFCAGLLKDVMSEASILNAELICHDRGIEIATSSTREHGAFASVIDVTVEGEEHSFQASGTVFGKNMPRLVEMRDYPTECYMDGNLLVFTHQDVPGIIAYVGQILANEKVNIAQMAVGRRGSVPGGSAIGILNLDNEVSQDAIDAVNQFQGIEQARIIKLPPAGDLPDWLV